MFRVRSRRVAVIATLVAGGLLVTGPAFAAPTRAAETTAPPGTDAGGSTADSTGAAAVDSTETSSSEVAPPPILTDIPEAVATACASGGLIDIIRDRGTLNWAIGVSPPF